MLQFNSRNKKMIEKWCNSNYLDKHDEIIQQYIELAGLTERIKATGCAVCGYKKSQSGLHFHHLGEKTEPLSRLRRSNPLCMVKEIALHPILLLCANCHAEVHDGLLDVSAIECININIFVSVEIKDLSVAYNHQKVKRVLSVVKA